VSWSSRGHRINTCLKGIISDVLEGPRSSKCYPLSVLVARLLTERSESAAIPVRCKLVMCSREGRVCSDAISIEPVRSDDVPAAAAVPDSLKQPR
jgi:hypothetical protein